MNKLQSKPGTPIAYAARLETNFVDWQDGLLCIKYETSLYNAPRIQTMWWPILRCSRADAEYILGREAVSQGMGNGAYSVKFGEGLAGRWETLRLPEGGSTKAFKTEEREYPMPPVRKGIETRYRSGRWEKYLKTQGWVTA